MWGLSPETKVSYNFIVKGKGREEKITFFEETCGLYH